MGRSAVVTCFQPCSRSSPMRIRFGRSLGSCHPRLGEHCGSHALKSPEAFRIRTSTRCQFGLGTVVERTIPPTVPRFGSSPGVSPKAPCSLAASSPCVPFLGWKHALTWHCFMYGDEPSCTQVGVLLRHHDQVRSYSVLNELREVDRTRTCSWVRCGTPCRHTLLPLPSGATLRPALGCVHPQVFISGLPSPRCHEDPGYFGVPFLRSGRPTRTASPGYEPGVIPLHHVRYAPGS